MLRVHDGVANGGVDGALARVNQGTLNLGAKLQLWSGLIPAALADPPAGTLLVEYLLANPAFGVGGAVPLAAGNAQLAGLPLVQAGLANGQIGFVRMLDRDVVPVWDDDNVGVADANVIVSSTTVQTAVNVTVQSYLFHTTPPTVGA